MKKSIASARSCGCSWPKAAFFFRDEIRLRVEKFVVHDPKPSVPEPPVADREEVNDVAVTPSVFPQRQEVNLPGTQMTVAPQPGEVKKKLKRLPYPPNFPC